MKNFLSFFALMLLLVLVTACKKEISDNTQQVVESGKPAPQPSSLISLQWQQCLGTPELDFGYGVSETSDGYYIAGYTNSPDGRTSASLYRVNFDRTVILDAFVHGSGSEKFESVVTTSDGGCLAAGSTSSPELKGANGGDILLVKFSSTLGVEWKRTIGGSGGENAHALIKTSDSKYALTGYTSSTDGDIASSTSGKPEVWIVKFDISSSGPVIEWETKVPGIAGSNSEQAYSLAEGVNGDFTVIGSSYFPNPDIFVAITDNAGNVKHTNRIGSPDIGIADIGWSVSASNDNTGFVFTGSLGSNTIIRKISSNGDFIWERSYVLGSARSIVSTPDGIILVGLTSNRTGDVVSTFGGQDLFVLRLNELGGKLDNRSFGGSKSDMGKRVIRTTDGNYIAVGETNSSNSGNVFGNHGGQDIWTVKFKIGN
jgi:hypothetical protein